MNSILLLAAILAGHPQPGAGATTLPASIRHYKSWTEVTHGASPIPIVLWIQCAHKPTPEDEAAELRKHGPHAQAYVRTYANTAAVQPLTAHGTPRFPEGSIIVKEKLPEAGDVIPVAIGVMVKHRVGFNPAGGDWEYLYYQSGLPVRVGAVCQDCHRERADQDYVFRSYLR